MGGAVYVLSTLDACGRNVSGVAVYVLSTLGLVK